MSDKKNILLITTYNPFLLRTGGHQRTHHLFNALTSVGNVDVLFFNRFDKDITIKQKNVFVYEIQSEETYLTKLKSCIQFFSSGIIMPTDKRCRNIYEQIISQKHYDIKIFRYLPTALMCGVKNFKDIIIDVDDIPWHNYYKMSLNPSYSWIRRLYFRFKYEGIKTQSLKIMSSCKLYYTANPNDCLTPNAKYLPNIPAIYENTLYQPNINKNILFVGFMNYPPNYQGIDHFIREIWSKVSIKHTKANLYIAGKGLPAFLESNWKSYQNVHILGYVDNLKELYENCAIAISPIYSGSGTNIKVLEALAMKKICIISNFAFKGFESKFVPDRDILIAFSDESYVNLLNSVLDNPQKYTSFAINGYQSVMNNFTISNIQKIIKQTLSEI